MANKVAIVTGASGNLGQAVVAKFLTEGYKVIGTVIPNDPVANTITHENFETKVVDLLDDAGSNQFIEGIISNHARIDVAILTVGGFAMGSISETKTADIIKQYRLNFETAYNIARPAFIQMMKQDSGRIFMMGSRPGLDAMHGKGMVAYSIAKSSLFQLAGLMNEEAKGTNVVTTIVVPSTIDTIQNRKSMPDADFEKWVTPHSIADIIFYHCTEQALVIREPILKVYNKS